MEKFTNKETVNRFLSVLSSLIIIIGFVRIVSDIMQGGNPASVLKMVFIILCTMGLIIFLSILNGSRNG